MRVTVYPNPEDTKGRNARIKLTRTFLPHGWQCNFATSGTINWHSGDLLIVDGEVLKSNDSPPRSSTPIVVVERGDCCSAWNTTYPHSDAVKQIWKNSVFDRAERYANHYWRDYLDNSDKDAGYKRDIALACTHKYVPFLTFYQMDRWNESQVWSDAPLKQRANVLFYAARNHPGTVAAGHRQQCLDNCNSLAATTDICVSDQKRPLNEEEFFRRAHNAKIMVSPWGFGECCYRDAEAIMAGAVLIKPDTSHVRSEPDLLRWPSCVTCKTDFSDLSSCVQHILDNLEQYQSHVRADQERLRQARSVETLTAQFKQLCEKAVSNDPPNH